MCFQSRERKRAGAGATSKEKPHRSGPQTFGTESDAARPGWAGDPASAYLASLFRSIPGQVRVLFSSPETPDNHRYRRSPERSFEAVSTKNPSAATAKGR